MASLIGHILGTGLFLFVIWLVAFVVFYAISFFVFGEGIEKRRSRVIFSWVLGAIALSVIEGFSANADWEMCEFQIYYELYNTSR